MKNLVTYAIWSHTGRRVTVLEGDANSVTFAAGTSFLVLDVDQANDGSAAVIFLAEQLEPGSPTSGEREQRILEHLRQKLALRSTPGAARFDLAGERELGDPGSPTTVG